MKRYIYTAVLIGLTLLLGSCWPTEPEYPRPEPWLCSINADGTGFRKIKKSPFNTPGLVDIYMTKDNRIIFYGEKLWISETDTISPVSITDNIYTLQQQPARLSQSPDGSKLYFASKDKNIHELDLTTMLTRQLTSESVRTLRNPIVSDLGNYITYSSRGYGEPSKATEYLYCLKLSNCESSIIPTSDSVSANAMYLEGIQTVYYEKLGQGLWKSHLDGSDQILVDANNNGGSPSSIFSFSQDLRYVIRWTNYPVYSVRLFDCIQNSAQEIPVHESLGGIPLGRLTQSSNMVFYVPKYSINKLMSYNLDTGVENELTGQIGNVQVIGFYILAPTWDGSKVYFYADVAEK